MSGCQRCSRPTSNRLCDQCLLEDYYGTPDDVEEDDEDDPDDPDADAGAAAVIADGGEPVGENVAMTDDPNSTPPVLYLGQDGNATSPRALVRYVILTPGGEDIDHVAYDAVQPDGVIDDDEGQFHRDVIGFAEFPKNQPVGRCTDFGVFCDYVEAKSVYVHWKPDEYTRDYGNEGEADD